MSKTKSLAFLEGDHLDLAPPFIVAWSEPGEIDGEVEVIWVSCGAGEGMRSGEYMVVKAKEDGLSVHDPPNPRQSAPHNLQGGPPGWVLLETHLLRAVSGSCAWSDVRLEVCLLL